MGIYFDSVLLFIGFCNAVIAFLYFILSTLSKKEKGISFHAFLGWSAAFFYQLALCIK